MNESLEVDLLSDTAGRTKDYLPVKCALISSQFKLHLAAKN